MRRGIVLLLAVISSASPLPGQDLLRLAPQGNEVGTESRAELWGTQGRSRSRSYWFGEWVSLSVTGMLLSPRVLSWSMTMRPYAGQQGGTESTSDSDLRNTGLSFGASVLAGFPVSATVHSHRASGRMVAATGGASEFRNATTGATVLWRNVPLPVTLSLARRATEDAWRSTPEAVPLRRDESLYTGRLEARNSKLVLAAERLDFVDRLGSLDFVSTNLQAEHTLRWGHGSWLVTQLLNEERTGSFGYDRSGGGLRMHVRHTAAASSDAYVDRRSGMTSGVAARQAATGYEIRHRTREWMGTSGSLAWNRSQFGNARITTSRIGTRAEFTGILPRGVRLTATSAANAEGVDRDLGDELWSQVLSETHRIEVTRGFNLPFPDVDVSSIQVRSIDQTVLYQQGTDFTVVSTGGTARIQLLPGGRLEPGDVVLVDYRYAAVDRGRHRIIGLSGDLYLGTDAVRVWVAEGQRWAHAEGTGQNTSTLGGRDRVLGATVQRVVGQGHLVLEASRRSRSRSAADLASREVSVAWTPGTSSAVRWTLGARGAVSSARGQRLSSYSTDASFSWSVSPTLQVLSRAERWTWRPTGESQEQYLSGQTEVNWRFGQVDLNGRYIFQRRTLTVNSDQHRFTLRLVRHF